MRTTIDLPADLHHQAMSTRSAVTGLPVIRLGTPITSDDVRALEDPET